MSLYEKYQAEQGIGAGPTPTPKGPTAPTTPSGGGGLYAKFQQEQQSPAPATTPTPKVQTEAPTTMWGKYSKGVNRLLGGLSASALESGGQLLRAVQWGSDRVVGTVIGKNIDTTQGFAYSAQDKTKEWGTALRKAGGITAENRTFTDKVIEGFGSSAVYFIPGMGIARGSTLLAKVSPKIAMFFGGSASAGLESMAEAGQVFDEVKKTQGFEKANDEATKTFYANAILLTVTNTLGVFNPAVKSTLKKALLSAPIEGLQESAQQIIQNQATGRPLGEGVIESGIIGSIVGGVMGGVSSMADTGVGAVIPPTEGGGLYDRFKQTAQATVTTAKTIAEAIKQVESGGDYNAKGSSGENGAYQFMPATWSGWAKKYLGNASAPMTPANQDLVAERQIQSWLDQGYTAEQVALSWNHGSPKRVKGTNSFGVAYDSGAYADKVLAQLGAGGTVTKSAIEMQRELERQGGSLPSPTGQTPENQAPTATTEGQGSGNEVDIKQPTSAEKRPETTPEQEKQKWDDHFTERKAELETELNDIKQRIKDATEPEEISALQKEQKDLETEVDIIEQGFIPEDEFNTDEGFETEVEEEPESKPSRTLGLMDDDATYTDNMKALIKDAQDNGGTFPYTKMTNEEQAIVDQAFRTKISKAKVTIPKDFKPYEATITTETVDIKRLSEPAYFKEVYESTFAVGGDKGLYKILTKELVPKGREASSFLADLYNEAKASLKKETKSQEEIVKETVSKEAMTIKEVAEATGIKEPNIRRILGQGAKKGVFERVEKGVYILNNGTEDIAFVHTADAIESLPKLAEQGLKVDMVFLDIPYNTPAVKGGNRGVAYNLISPDEFRTVMNAVSDIVRTEETPVYYMFSQAESGMKAMMKYNEILDETGFKVVAKGDWQKTFKDGSPVTNVRAKVARPEGILLLNKKGVFVEKDADRNLDFTTIRPRGYSTEKPVELLNSLILQGTKEGDIILDPFAGSGVAGAEAVKTGRKAVLIEKNEKVAEEITKPRVKKALQEREESEPTPKDELRLELQDAPEAKENPVMTEIEGKEVPRYGIDRKFGSKSLVAFTKKPLLTKTDIKTIIKYTPEFRNNPVLTVEEHTVDNKRRAVLTFRGKDTQFEIQANALGLVEENLKTGDQVRVSAETLSKTGKEFRVISYNQKTGAGSKYASVGRYRDDTEVFLSNPDAIATIQFPELVGLAKELSGNVPFIRKYTKANGMFYGKGSGEIGLHPDLFLRENLGQLQKTLAHEIGHLVDYLPDQTLSRGNLVGRLNTLQRFRKEFFKPSGATRSDAELREQMYELSKYWRPYEEASATPSFIAYRKSATEVYADFISALFNDPRTVSAMAPTAYNMFFEQLDRKPDVKRAYFELQDLLRFGDLTAKRRSATKEMFKLTEAESKERQVQHQIEQEEQAKSVWFKFKTEMVDITEVVKEDVKKAQAEGKFINPDDNPTYYLEERNYIGGKIKSQVDTKFNTIYQELQKDGMTWEDLGELMFYERVLKGDRQEIANPLGYQPDFVQELMEVYEDVGQVKADAEAHEKGTSDMKTTLGEDKFRKLQSLAVEYRENLKGFFEEGRTEGIYSEELAQLFEENAFYVPFKGAKYSGVTKTSFGVKSQKGTLDNIENPANTGIEKAVSIIRAIERNKVTRKTVEFYIENFSEEVTEAKLDKQGYPMKPLENNLSLVTYMKDGKVKGYYMDSYIAEAIQKNTSGQLNMIVSSLRFFNSKLFRPLFITFNLGFQAFNLIRDMKRFWKNVPNMTILKTLNLYSKSVRASKIRAFGLPDKPSAMDLEAYDLINRLENEQIISITYNDIIKGESVEDAQIERILRETGVREAKDTKLGQLGAKVGLDKNSPIIKQMFGIMDFIEKTGNMIETLPKVAGVKALEGKMEPREMRSFVRKYVGSPDFLAGGRDKKNINEVFLFANAIFQGIRSDYEIATTPKSRGAYWLKTAQSELIPKMLMIMAGAGLFGEWLKELFGKISEYDKTNYTTIPLGIDENGKAVYFRIPSDETGRLIGGMFWKVAGAVSDPTELAEFSTYTDMLSYAGGQVPSITPTITSGFNLTQFLAGENPYDFFRQRPVLTDDQQQAGGMERAKPFMTYMFQNLGGNVFVKLYMNETVPKNPSLSEKISSLPVVGNIAGRFIRTSNYGEVEETRKVSQEVRTDQAREGLANRRVVFDYVEQAQGKSDGEIRQLKKEMIQEVYGGFPKTPEDRRQAQSLEKRFDTLRIRGTADAQLDAIVTAQSNEEKVALLREYKKTMSPEKYEELKRFIIRHRVVSSAVFQQLNRVENNEGADE